MLFREQNVHQFVTYEDPVKAAAEPTEARTTAAENFMVEIVVEEDLCEYSERKIVNRARQQDLVVGFSSCVVVVWTFAVDRKFSSGLDEMQR